MNKELQEQNVQEMIEQLAKKNRAPKNVEQFGIEPIPKELKTVKWYDLFAIFASFFITPVHMMIPGMMILTTGLSFWGAIWSQVIGATIAFIAFALFAVAGTEYGLPGAVAMRFSLGSKFSRYVPSILRAITSIILFAAQTLGGGLAIQSLLRSLTGNTYNIIIISLIFAIFQTLVAIIGFDSFKKLTRWIFPIKMLGMGYIAYLLVSSDLPNFQWSYVTGMPPVNPGWGAFAISVSTATAIFMTLITDSSDFTRYTRSRLDMWVGVVLGAATSVFVAAFFGAYAAVAIQNWNVFEAMTHFNPSIPILLFLLLMIILDNWSVNILNLYTGGLCLVNAIPKLGRFWATVLTGIIATILSCFPVIIDQVQPIIENFGFVYSPLVGVLIADFVFLKKYKVNVHAVFDEKGQYAFTKGVNWLAAVLCVTGAFTYHLFPVTVIPAMCNAILIGVLYYGLVKVLSPYWTTLRIATKPYEEKEVEEITDNSVDIAK